jgi:hypothetical protein
MEERFGNTGLEACLLFNSSLAFTSEMPSLLPTA